MKYINKIKWVPLIPLNAVFAWWLGGYEGRGSALEEHYVIGCCIALFVIVVTLIGMHMKDDLH